MLLELCKLFSSWLITCKNRILCQRPHLLGTGKKQLYYLRAIKKPGLSMKRAGLFFYRPRLLKGGEGDWQRPTFARPIDALSSGLQRFTSVFGMGTGGTTALGSPEERFQFRKEDLGFRKSRAINDSNPKPAIQLVIQKGWFQIEGWAALDASALPKS